MDFIIIKTYHYVQLTEKVSESKGKYVFEFTLEAQFVSKRL